MTRQRSLLTTALVIALIAAAGVFGFSAYRWLAARAPAQESVAHLDPGSRSVGDISPQEPEAEPEPPSDGKSSRLPAVRPVFSLRDRAGQMRSITEWDGKSLVINFWATWCAPCRREIPMLKTLHQSRAAENVEVIGVAVDFRDDVLAYANKMGIDYPVLIGEQDGYDAIASFGAGAAGLPFTVFTDNQARIVTAHLGELHAEEADVILDAVADINRGKVSLEQGQQRIARDLKDSVKASGSKKEPPGPS